MQIGNRIKETTTTATAGDLTLAGAVTNFRTFNTAFGTTRRFTYWIVDATNNAWERGIGYLSSSTVLVREAIRSNSSGTLVALTLGAGTKNVFCELGAEDMSINPTYIRAPRTFTSAHLAGFDDTGTNIVTANRLYLEPFKFLAAGSLNALVVDVNTAVAASKARAGIWQLNTLGEPGALLATTADLDTTTTGTKTGTFTAIPVSAGWYFVGLLCSGAVTFTSTITSRSEESFLGRSAGSSGIYPVVMLYDDITAGWTVLPNPPVIDGELGFGGGSPPIINARFA